MDKGVFIMSLSQDDALQRQIESYKQQLMQMYQRRPKSLEKEQPVVPTIVSPSKDEGSYYSGTEFQDNNLKVGYLKITTTIARRAIPIEGARCVVSKDIGGERRIFYDVYTDEDGSTEKLPLPAPDKSFSEQPESNHRVSASYDIEVTKPGFVPVTDLNVPIFDGILSIQSVNLIPDTNSNQNPDPIIIDESYPSDERR